jgi:hypothetical protein
MVGEDKETIIQKAFVVDPKTGKVTLTSKTVDREPGASKTVNEEVNEGRFESARGVFKNPKNVPSPLDKELSRIEEDELHKKRGRLLETMRKLGLNRK